MRLPSTRTDDDSVSVQLERTELGVQRDERGRILPGSRPPGGGAQQAMATLRETLRWEILRAATPDDVVRVLDALKQKAFKGDVFAAREWLDRTVGKVQDVTPQDLPRIVLELSPTLAGAVRIDVTQVQAEQPLTIDCSPAASEPDTQ